MATLFLVFWETNILFSIVAALIYIPTSSVGGFPSLHTLSSICYLYSIVLNKGFHITFKEDNELMPLEVIDIITE